MVLSVPILLFTCLSLTTAYTCISSQHPPPPPRDCHSLIDALEILSTNPPYNRPLLWSRHTQDTTTSLRLPKSYRIVTQYGNTCAIHVDTIPYNEDAEDRFSISSVGNVAEILVEQCLVRHGKVGWGFPGVKGNIHVSIMRVDWRWLGRGFGRGNGVVNGLVEGIEFVEESRNWTAVMRNGTDVPLDVLRGIGAHGLTDINHTIIAEFRKTRQRRQAEPIAEEGG